MKKNLFGWLAMAAMLVGTGCSTDEVVNDYSPENAIQFGTYVGRDAESRVSVTTIDVLKASSYPGFGVFANYSTNNGVALTPNFINNTQVTWNTSAWTYSPVKYWPNNDTDQVTFWAYGPWDTNNTVPNADAPHFAISDGTDYVAAGPVTKSKSTIKTGEDPNGLHRFFRYFFSSPISFFHRKTRSTLSSMRFSLISPLSTAAKTAAYCASKSLQHSISFPASTAATAAEAPSV